MPGKGDNNNFHKQLNVPFVIYAYFEAMLEKINGCKPNNNKSYNGYKVVCCYDHRQHEHGVRGCLPPKNVGNECLFYHMLNLGDLNAWVKCLRARYSLRSKSRTS